MTEQFLCVLAFGQQALRDAPRDSSASRGVLKLLKTVRDLLEQAHRMIHLAQ